MLFCIGRFILYYLNFLYSFALLFALVILYSPFNQLFWPPFLKYYSHFIVTTKSPLPINGSSPRRTTTKIVCIKWKAFFFVAKRNNCLFKTLDYLGFGRTTRINNICYGTVFEFHAYDKCTSRAKRGIIFEESLKIWSVRVLLNMVIRDS